MDGLGFETGICMAGTAADTECDSGIAPQSADACANGTDARLTAGVDEIVQTLAEEAAPGDLVLILSNGGFGGIYTRLPEALEAQSG